MMGALPMEKPRNAAIKTKSTYIMTECAGNAALTDQPHQLEVIQNADEGRGDVAHQLGRAVAAGLQKLTDIQLCAGEVQAGAVRDEEYERDDAADAVAGDRRPCRARQAEELNEHPVAGEIVTPEAMDRIRPMFGLSATTKNGWSEVWSMKGRLPANRIRP